jgi:two-component system sensor histidine kinase MprB
MSLRWRIALGLAAVAALVGAFAAAGAYLTTARQLRNSVDETLLARARALEAFGPRDPGRGPGRFLRCPSAGSVQPAAAAQLVLFDGRVLPCIEGAPALPVDDEDLTVAAGGSSAYVLRSVSDDGVPYRQLTIPWRQGVALQIARDVSEQEQTLDRLRMRLAVLTLVGVATAAGLGWLLAGRIVRPVRRLRDAAEGIAATNDLSTPLPTDGPGEVGSLARSLSTMVGALATSRAQQQRLVEDASHELRTPLTTLRTNVELLQRAPDLPEAERAAVLRDLDTESRELTDLANELVELATDRASTDDVPETVDLGELAEVGAARARRRTGRTVRVTTTGATTLVGRPRMLERAIANLIDNALKYADADSPVDVVVDGTTVEVRDRGPGIDPADQPLVFERFYRATTARTAPGSGLGLAIVRQIVERHGGEVWARNLMEATPTGDGDSVVVGAAVGFRLREAPAPAARS